MAARLTSAAEIILWSSKIKQKGKEKFENKLLVNSIFFFFLYETLSTLGTEFFSVYLKSMLSRWLLLESKYQPK